MLCHYLISGLPILKDIMAYYCFPDTQPLIFLALTMKQESLLKKKTYQLMGLTPFIIIAVLLFSIGSVFANPVKVMILPFQINAEKNLEFLKTGIQDMLGSRLAWQDKVVVIDRSTVNNTVTKLDQYKGDSLALLAGGQLKADFIITGSVTILGQGASIDAKMMDITGKMAPVSFFGQTNDLGGVIPEINQFATTINETVFHRQMVSGGNAPTLPQPSSASQQTLNPLLAPQNSASQGAAAVNPNFKTDTSRQLNSGFWKSRPIPLRILGMDIGDVNKDGILETVALTDDSIIIYQMQNNLLVKKAEVPISKFSHHLGLDIGDINGNGIPEIFVSSLAPERNRATSFVLEYNGRTYDTLAKNAPWYYRISQKLSGETLLIGQKQRNKDSNIYNSPVYKMKWQDNTYIPAGQLLNGKTANTMGLAVDDIRGNGVETIAAYDTAEHLAVFGNAGEVLWRSSEPSGGTLAGFILPKDNREDDDQLQFFPLRIRIHDIDKDGTLEIITATNHDVAMSFFSNLRKFDKGHLESRSWTDMGLNLNWKTAPLPGRISDFVIGDFDNDGFDELIAATITKEGTMVMSQASSILVAYELLKTDNQ